jgi:hypothetical protein
MVKSRILQTDPTFITDYSSIGTSSPKNTKPVLAYQLLYHLDANTIGAYSSTDTTKSGYTFVSPQHQ